MFARTATIDKDEDLGLFNSNPHDECQGLNKGVLLLKQFQDLGYINFNSEIQQMQFTNPGINYLNRNLATVVHYIQKYNIQLADFGDMIAYMPQIFQELKQRESGWMGEMLPTEAHRQLKFGIPTLGFTQCKINDETGDIEDDPNKIVFSKKTPGEQMC